MLYQYSRFDWPEVARFAMSGESGLSAITVSHMQRFRYASALAAIPPMACWKAMKVYGELDRVQANRAADDKFRCNWSFVAMVARSTFIWALIDLPRHVRESRKSVPPP